MEHNESMKKTNEIDRGSMKRRIKISSSAKRQTNSDKNEEEGKHVHLPLISQTNPHVIIDSSSEINLKKNEIV